MIIIDKHYIMSPSCACDLAIQALLKNRGETMVTVNALERAFEFKYKGKRTLKKVTEGIETLRVYPLVPNALEALKHDLFNKRACFNILDEKGNRTGTMSNSFARSVIGDSIDDKNVTANFAYKNHYSLFTISLHNGIVLNLLSVYD